MEYLATWIEGEEVEYLFLSKEGLTELIKAKKDINIIYTKVYN